jgi:hypothetical protein
MPPLRHAPSWTTWAFENQLLSNEYREQIEVRGVKLTARLLLVSKSRLLEINLYSPHVFMAWCAPLDRALGFSGCAHSWNRSESPLNQSDRATSVFQHKEKLLYTREGVRCLISSVTSPRDGVNSRPINFLLTGDCVVDYGAHSPSPHPPLCRSQCRRETRQGNI